MLNQLEHFPNLGSIFPSIVQFMAKQNVRSLLKLILFIGNDHETEVAHDQTPDHDPASAEVHNLQQVLRHEHPAEVPHRDPHVDARA